MKVIVKNVTGSETREALIDKDSGVLEFADGEISHVMHEKSMNKTIYVMKATPKEAPTSVTTSADQSGESIKKVNKRK